jgi:hypothetical protein
MVTSQEEPFDKASPELMKQAGAFLKKHGAKLDEEISFLERRGNEIDAQGRMVRDLSENGVSTQLKAMVVALRDIEHFGVVDPQALIGGYRVLGAQTRITREIAVHDSQLAGKAQDIIRKKRDIPDFLPLDDDDKRAARKFRKARLEFSHDMEGVADEVMNIQSDLMDLMKGLGIKTRVIRPPTLPEGNERM